MFGAQAVPVLGILLAMIRADYLPGAILYAGAAGVAYEALSGRAARAWLMLPIAGLLLATIPRLMENRLGAHERDRVAGEDQPGPGPGAQGLDILVDSPEIARALARGYAVFAVHARRAPASVEFVAYRRPPGAPAGTFTETLLPEEPSGLLTVSTTATDFQRGRIQGYDLRTTARWPDGRRRARAGVIVAQVGWLAFPVAGCPLGPWLREEPCGVRLARPGTRTYGYLQPYDSEVEAAAVAELIGLAPLT